MTAAQQALSNGPGFSSGASLGFAKAVEVVLEDWLPAPKGQRGWTDRTIGKWAGTIGRMTSPKERRAPLDPVLRRQFNARYEKELAEALDILGDLRAREAHHGREVPRPQLVRKYVLGTETRLSIFELILRFAKRMRD